LNISLEIEETMFFDEIEKEFLYEIDFNKETFESKLNFQLKEYQDIVRYFYCNRF
jgi:hypothetical protein